MAPGAAARAILVVPASDDRKLDKAATLPCRELVVDLEDAVEADAKHRARRKAVEFLQVVGATRAVTVRVNALDGAEGGEDLAALAAANTPPRAVVLPKVDGPAQVAAAEQRLRALDIPCSLHALIETALGLAAVRSIAGASTLLEALVIGYEDLGADLGRVTPDVRADVWLAAQHELLLAARTHGLQAIDGPTLEFRDKDAVARSCALTAAMGFDAKWAIHPDQIGPIQDALSVRADDRRRARAVVAALDRAAATGGGAAELDGRMVDAATARWARAVLAEDGR